jgi:hypothetical protein
MGRLASLGFNWMYHGASISVEQELEAFTRVTREDLGLLLVDWPLWPMTIVSVGPQVSGQWSVVSDGIRGPVLIKNQWSAWRGAGPSSLTTDH